MIRGLYTAAAGMIANQRKHDAVTANIANLNTPGYKAQQAVTRSFPEMLIRLMNEGPTGQSRHIGAINTGVFVEELLPMFTQGDLQETGSFYDLALESRIRVFEEVDGEQVEIVFDASGLGTNQAGETVYRPQAFFTVLNNEDEIRYTRNGKLYVGADGVLRTTDHMRVVGTDGQPIVLDRSMEQVRVAPNGALLDLNGEPLPGDPQLLIARIDNPFLLMREGNGVFRLEAQEDADAAPVPADAGDFAVHQGFVERSNVDPAQSMVDLMTALRSYEANQRMIQYLDRVLEKAVNDIGRV